MSKRVELIYDFHLGAFGIRPGSFIAFVEPSGKVTLSSATLKGFAMAQQSDILGMIRSLETLNDMKVRAKIAAGVEHIGDAIVFDWDGPSAS